MMMEMKLSNSFFFLRFDSTPSQVSSQLKAVYVFIYLFILKVCLVSASPPSVNPPQSESAEVALFSFPSLRHRPRSPRTLQP